MNKVSFIVPSYNSYRTVSRTIKSILTQTHGEEVCEVIVVDSSDDTRSREVLRDVLDSRVKLIYLDRKTPPAVGRNIGASAACGDILCFIDSDVELFPDWLEQIDVAVQKGALLGSGSITIPQDQKTSLLPLAQYYLQFNEYMDLGSTKEVLFVPSCNLFCDRDVFLKVGGFPDMRASEDVMFCLKAGALAKVWFVPEARCAHIFRKEWGAFLKNQELLGKYVMIYRKRHYKSWFYQGWWPLFFLPAFLVIKAGRMNLRIVQGGPKHLMHFIVSLSVFIIGFMAWAWGFLKGIFEKDQL